MGRTVARGKTTTLAAMAANSFAILDNEQALDHPSLTPKRTGNALGELHIDHYQNRATTKPLSTKGLGHDLDALVVGIDKLKLCSPSPSKAKAPGARTTRPRRPPIDLDIFEPLSSVQEEISTADASLSVVNDSSLHNNPSPQAAYITNNFERNHKTLREAPNPDCSIREQVERHLAATPLKRNVHLSSEMEEFNALADGGFLAWTQPSLYSTTPLKVPQIVQAVESAVSPSLTIISDRSCSIGCSSSRTGSFSIPRIEDSLEELDKLEDELEAVGEVTRARRINLAEGRIPTAIPDTIPELRTSKSMKRASMMCMSATVRAKSSESTKPALRRSASLTLRGQRHDAVDMAPLQNMDGMSSRVKFGGTHQTSSNMSTRSAKPPTIARFELPGDAVARRLKEQRETRQAQQAEVQKAGASPPKVKSNRLLAKPSFELPGEAISRRKREERETKLREQEEEERKRREFKARPVRYNTAQNSISRDTITSRIRLTKTQEENAEKKNSEAMKSKRMSIGTSRSGSAITPAAKAPSVRGRNPIIIQGDDMSRGTSASASSSSGKGSSVCVEIAAQQRVRSHQIYTRDNSSYTLHREREKREREATAKAAREQAAERSRIASREWAEKQRRKEAMQQQRRSTIHQA